ncbi:glycosyltransferase family 2 protein [Candidatus Merdisoma sp. HCP28S3_D10]|uniref:glycosyltransferase family 2 protein n=1 Tax=unclassified Candidatus Merdisoma TaxID=3099611 RepID=UPI003F89730D
MKVSFLVTYYNQKEYVRQSMESILAIDKPCDWEILVGDDGSTDGTIEVVNEYIQQYPSQIKLYIMPRMQDEKYDSVKRASANRLNILEHSTGDIFCTLDGDDYYCDTSFIKKAIEVFESNVSISIVAFGFRYVTDGVLGKEHILPSEVSNQCIDKKNFLENYYMHAGGCVYRKVFDTTRIEYIKKLGYFDDNNIVVNSLNYGEMFAVNRPIYAYRQTGQSVYTSMNELEQAVLNVQGLDVDLRLMNDEWHDAIIERYSEAIILMYIWRKHIYSILGNEKCLKYKAGCANLMPSYCYELLEYRTIESKKLDVVIKKIFQMKKTYTIKQYIKYYTRGFINEKANI